MRTLLHVLLSPACRVVRIALAEKRIAFTLAEEPVWERRPAFLALNPAGEVPVLISDDAPPLADTLAICEYLEETVPEPPLHGADPVERAEVRRLFAWFHLKFSAEVTENLVGEKLMKRRAGGGQPDSRAIRAGHANIHAHLDYIAYLTGRRNWLAGERLTFADLAAAAHLSCVDYIGDVPWDEHADAKDWYARIKSRPSIRPLLTESLPGLPPTPSYADLDF